MTDYIISLANLDALKTKLEEEASYSESHAIDDGYNYHFDRMETPQKHRENGRTAVRCRRKATFASKNRQDKMYDTFYPGSQKRWKPITRKAIHYSEASKLDYLGKKEALRKKYDTKLRKKYVGRGFYDEAAEFNKVLDQEIAAMQHQVEVNDFTERMLVSYLCNQLAEVADREEKLGRAIFILAQQYGHEKVQEYLRMAKEIIESA